VVGQRPASPLRGRGCAGAAGALPPSRAYHGAYSRLSASVAPRRKRAARVRMLYHCSRHFWAFTAVEQCVAGEPRALECTHALVPSHCLQGKGWGVERPTDRRRFRGQATHSPSLPERLQARIHTQTHEKPMLRAAYARAFPTSEGLGSSGCGLLWVYSSLPCNVVDAPRE